MKLNVEGEALMVKSGVTIIVRDVFVDCGVALESCKVSVTA